ncbi:rhodanese domain-containing protein CG4456 isoform X2 [Temnothorax americanus]|uniref:rhodanese domain-containing protein CG4456 isoform X2 n=1 Tax=Temnothorax americanus TaxID=1964332 RepID=UPI004068FC59
MGDKSVIRTLYSSNIIYREKDSAASCENGMALEVNYEQLLEEQKDPNTLIVDIREPSEISETGALPGSIHIPMGDVRNVFENFSEEEFREKYGKPKPTTDTKIIFSCRSGKRSASMRQTMQNIGYARAHHYPGGWLEWEEKSAGRRK